MLLTQPVCSRAKRSDGQIVLIGPALYLRPIESADAATAPIWHPERLSGPIERRWERIQQQLGATPDAEAARQRLLICSRCVERPIGSVHFTYENERVCTLHFTHDPASCLDRRAAVEADVLRFALPFLIGERQLMKVTTDHLGDHAVVRETAAALGMRRCYRLREAYTFAGQRIDRIGYEFLNPLWVRLLGMPREMEDGAVEREVRAPAPLRWHPAKRPTAQAIAASDRLELRPFAPGDGAQMTHAFLREREHFYPQGMPLRNPWVFDRHMAELARQEPPEEIRLAVVESESGQLIGTIGVAQLDLVDGRGKTTYEIFDPAYRGKGYGTEAMHLLLEYLFEQVGLHMVYCWVSDFNTRSLASVRKQGYREAGYFAWEDLSDAGYAGGVYFDLLASEWQAARG